MLSIRILLFYYFWKQNSHNYETKEIVDKQMKNGTSPRKAQQTLLHRQ